MTPELYGCAAPALRIFGSGAPPSARTITLAGANPLGPAPERKRTVPGTSARGATAGGVHVVEGTAAKEGSLLAPQKLTRVFRVTGRGERPFEQIAEWRPGAERIARFQNDPIGDPTNAASP